MMKRAPRMPGVKRRARRPSEQIDDQDPGTKIKHLRNRHGAAFAPGWDGERTLGELLEATRFESLAQYVKHGGCTERQA